MPTQDKLGIYQCNNSICYWFKFWFGLTCMLRATLNLPLCFIHMANLLVLKEPVFCHKVVSFFSLLVFLFQCPLQWTRVMLDGNFSIVCGSVVETILCLVSSGRNINRSHTTFLCGMVYFYNLKHDDIFEEQISHSASRTSLSEVCHKTVFKLFTCCGAYWE